MLALVVDVVGVELKLTITASVQVNYRPHADIDDAQEALVLLLELLLVEYLHGQDALLVHSPACALASSVARSVAQMTYMSKLSFQ